MVVLILFLLILFLIGIIWCGVRLFQQYEGKGTPFRVSKDNKNKEMAGLIMELARLTGTPEMLPGVDDLDTFVENLDKDAINELFSLRDITGLDRFVQGKGSELCSRLNSIRVGRDHDLQFLRFLAGYSGRVPCSTILKYHCKLANLSQSFCRCVSARQWLRTVIERRVQKQEQNQRHALFFAMNLLSFAFKTIEKNERHVITFHSNIVPGQAYLSTIEASCRRNGCAGCTGGFLPTSVLCDEVGEPPSQSCTDFAEELRRGGKVDGELVPLLSLRVNDVKSADGHAVFAKGSQGQIYKVVWRNGIFVRKEFELVSNDHKCPDFNNEIEVARKVSHPNIVHCFGEAMWNLPSKSKPVFNLFMELLEDDLGSLLQISVEEGLLSFRDSLHVLLQVAEAMKHLHEKCFVHGDLKPGNILLSRLTMPHSDVKFYLVKVADFGCTQRVDSASGATVMPFNFEIGSNGYVAPEVLRGRAGPHRGDPLSCPQKVDVYSFGVVAFQVLTGATWTDIERGYSRKRVQKEDGDEDQWRPKRPLDFEARNPDHLPDRLSLLEHLIRRCWSSSPEARPTFTDILNEIQPLYSRLFPSH